MTSLASGELSKEINGKRTEVLLQKFADRYLVLVTQMGKVGNLIQASIPATAPLTNPNVGPESSTNSLPEPSPAVQLTTLLGAASSEHIQALHSLYAAQIATIIWTEETKTGLDNRKSIVVGLALSKLDGEADEVKLWERELFEGVMTMIHDLMKSALGQA